MCSFNNEYSDRYTVHSCILKPTFAAPDVACSILPGTSTGAMDVTRLPTFLQESCTSALLLLLLFTFP